MSTSKEFEVVKSVCSKFNFDTQSLSFVRSGTNMLFRSKNSDVALKVHNSSKTLDRVKQEIDFANFLTSSGLATAVPMCVEENPTIIDGYLVSLWHWIYSYSKSTVDWELWGSLLHNFHVTASKYPSKNVSLGIFNLSDNVRGRLRSLANLRFLSKIQFDLLIELEEFASSYFDTSYWLNAKGVIHGDAHLGNVLSTFGDGLVLLDFDAISRGDTLWDLIPTLVALNRFNLPERDYDSFCKGYGYDIREWDMVNAALVLRELSMVTWLSLKCYNDYSLREEVDLRISTLKDRNITWNRV